MQLGNDSPTTDPSNTPSFVNQTAISSEMTSSSLKVTSLPSGLTYATFSPCVAETDLMTLASMGSSFPLDRPFDSYSDKSLHFFAGIFNLDMCRT